ARLGFSFGGGFLGVGALAPELGLGYAMTDLLADGTALASFEARAGLGASFPLAQALSARAALSGRYAYYRLVQGETVTSGGSPGLEGELGLELGLGERFGLGLGAALGWDFGMFGFVRPYLSAAYRLGGSGAERPASDPPAKPRPLVGEAEAEAESPAAAAAAPAGAGGPLEASFDGIFPVYYTYYDENPFGSVIVRNTGKAAWSDVKVTVSMRGVMDSPRVISPGRPVAGGEALSIPVTALFNSSILAVTEATKLTVDVTLEYREGSRARKETASVALRVYDRNAMSWADDRSAAAFVTAKDPAILTLAKGLAGAAGAARNPAINDKLQLVAAVHDALCLYGVNYVTDPTSVFSGGKDAAEVDFLQFPRQTLEYRAGDCDDLTILYCAMLEAVGVETAFVTVPGHIYMAASLGLSPAEARARFGRVDELVFHDDKAWLPLEVTIRKPGLLAAWAEGAKQWREYSARDQATFIPVHSAWEAYEPVALPGATTLASLPVEKAVAAMRADTDDFVLREIGERVAKYQAEILKSSNNARAVNSLGLLYAQYGLYDKAKAQFESVVAREEYPAALVNLGNVLKLEGKLESALAFYERAYRKSPGSPQVLLAVARANHEMENYGVVKKYYAELAKVDPTLAARYAYLDMKGEEGTRAAEAAGLKEAIEWMEEK
ncbi:MAG: hypothetical protein JXA15_13410, partial [Spirochaetales bacterium]|nr:hypothetical protein [Spirochaetales bacterium]